eukprot:3021089-Rhodomonas_salina.1
MMKWESACNHSHTVTPARHDGCLVSALKRAHSYYYGQPECALPSPRLKLHLPVRVTVTPQTGSTEPT